MLSQKSALAVKEENVVGQRDLFVQFELHVLVVIVRRLLKDSLFFFDLGTRDLLFLMTPCASLPSEVSQM